MSEKTSNAGPEQHLPAGVMSELAVQFGHDLYGSPFLRIVKRTRRSTSDLSQLVAKNRLFSEAEVTDLQSWVAREIMTELEITNGVQLALRLD